MQRNARFAAREVKNGADDDDWETEADFVNTAKLETTKKDITTGKAALGTTASAAAQMVKGRQVQADTERGINSASVAKKEQRAQGIEVEKKRVAEFEVRQAESIRRCEEIQGRAAAERKRGEEDRERMAKAREDERMRKQGERDKDIEARRTAAEEEGKKDVLDKISREKAFNAAQDSRMKQFEEEQRRRAEQHADEQRAATERAKDADAKRLREMEERNCSIDEVNRQREATAKSDSEARKKADDEFYRKQAERERAFDAQQRDREAHQKAGQQADALATSKADSARGQREAERSRAIDDSRAGTVGTGGAYYRPDQEIRGGISDKKSVFTQAAQKQPEPQVQRTGKTWAPKAAPPPPAASSKPISSSPRKVAPPPPQAQPEPEPEPQAQQEVTTYGEPEPAAPQETQPQEQVQPEQPPQEYQQEQPPQEAYQEQPPAQEETAPAEAQPEVQAEQPQQEEQPQQQEEPAPLQPASGVSSYKAVYDYAGEAEGDLSFKEGDIITVIDTSDPSGWWVGQVGDGPTGNFPSNFVEPC